jgi:hypothetical protein
VRSVKRWTKAGSASLIAALAVALPASSTAEPPIQVFVLAGQSNMVGRAEPVSDGTGPTPNLLQWNNGAWQPAADPLGPDSEPDSGVGPGMTFGIGVLAHEPPGTTVGLIMCARGSTSIGNWIPGSSVYSSCRKAVSAAGGQIAGIVFLQGEHEAANPNGGEQWAAGFAKSEPAFEHDFGPTPFVLGQIGNLDPERSPYQQQVRDAQAAAATAHPEIALVTTTDLPVEGVHFTVSAEKTLGTRFADAWYTLSQRSPTLADVSPGSGLAGDTVTITGSGFDIATSVRFGSAAASYQIDSDAQITATVPDSAVTGTVSVRTLLGIATAPSPFAVLPTVGSFAPDSAKPGTAVKLTGKAFKGVTLVTVNGVPATFKVRSLTSLKLRVPSGATSGPISVTNAAGTSSSVGTFTVNGP